MSRSIAVRSLLASLLVILFCALSRAAWANQDVVLLMNGSAAMADRNAAQAQLRAMTDFIQNSESDTRIALMTFGAEPKLLAPFTPLNTAGRRQLVDALRRVSYGGGQADVATGLEGALAEIINHGDRQALKSIILVTHGSESTGKQAADADKTRWILQSLVPAAIYNQVHVFGIERTPPADATLQTVAEKTGGSLHAVAQPADFAAAFRQIAAQLRNTVPLPQGLLPAGPVPSLATSAVSAKFATPLTQVKPRATGMRWLWFAALLAVVAAAVGIYAAWNMRGARTPKKLYKPAEPQTGGPRAVLYDISNPNDIKRFELGERATLLGRVAGYDPEVQYILVKEKTVGRCHAVIERRGHSFWLMDQGSINGTFVNGERISADRALKHGDIIAIHRHEFEFMIPEYFESESTVVGAREQLTSQV